MEQVWLHGKLAEKHFSQVLLRPCEHEVLSVGRDAAAIEVAIVLGHEQFWRSSVGKALP